MAVSPPASAVAEINANKSRFIRSAPKDRLPIRHSLSNKMP